MATTAVSEALQERIESARRLHWELTRCQKELEEVRSAILARGKPDDIRRQFRACQSAMMMCGRLLLLDGRFKPRLPSDVRDQALDLLRAGAKPIELQRKLGLDNFTVRRLRHRELGDNRDLRKLRRLNDEQVAEIRAGKGTVRRHFAQKFGVSMSLISKAHNSRGPYREMAKVSAVPQATGAGRATMKLANRELKLKLSRPLIASLSEMAALAGEAVEPYLTSLVETQIADWRLRRIPSDYQYRDVSTPAPAIPEQEKKKGRSRFSREECDEIRDQHASGIKVAELAERRGCGASTIRRALNDE